MTPEPTPVPAAAPVAPEAARSAAPTPFARAREWLWRGDALSAARSLASSTRDQQEFARRAELAAELAHRALEPTEPLSAGSGRALSLSLYREAAYWALRVHAPESGARDLPAALAAVPRDLLRAAAGGDEAVAALRAQFERSFVELASDPPAEVEHVARATAAFVSALLDRAADRQQQSERVLLERFVRTSSALLAACAVAVAVSQGLHGLLVGPDLAAGRPWTTSSTAAKCEPQLERCNGERMWVLFLTKKEKNPWFQIDLGTTRVVNRVEVVNRRDCCQDNAVPLVVEVGTDGKSWKQVARKEEDFHEWVAEFPSVTARYVRLVADRRTKLHLEQVRVRGP